MNKNRTRIRLGLSSEFFSPKGVKYVNDSVATEAERAQEAESKLNTALENHMQSADDMFNALGDGRFEVAKATEAQTVANGAISKEKLDGPLQVSVSVVDNLETENTLMPLSARQGVVLDGKIKNEYDGRVYGEKLLESKIVAETERAQTAESTLQSELAKKPGTKIANKGEVFNASNNSANGSYSHAEGYGTNAAGLADHTEGRETTATGGQGSHAEGWGSETSGNASHVEGYFTQAKNYGEHAEGRCNYSIGGDETPTVHTVGVGEINTATGAITRKNAHAITRDGKHYLLGVGGYEGCEVSGCKDLASVINKAITKTNLDGELQLSVSVVDNLETENAFMPLSARQGVVLNEKINYLRTTVIPRTTVTIDGRNVSFTKGYIYLENGIKRDVAVEDATYTLNANDSLVIRGGTILVCSVPEENDIILLRADGQKGICSGELFSWATKVQLDVEVAGTKADILELNTNIDAIKLAALNGVDIGAKNKWGNYPSEYIPAVAGDIFKVCSSTDNKTTDSTFMQYDSDKNSLGGWTIPGGNSQERSITIGNSAVAFVRLFVKLDGAYSQYVKKNDEIVFEYNSAAYLHNEIVKVNDEIAEANTNISKIKPTGYARFATGSAVVDVENKTLTIKPYSDIYYSHSGATGHFYRILEEQVVKLGSNNYIKYNYLNGTVTGGTWDNNGDMLIGSMRGTDVHLNGNIIVTYSDGRLVKPYMSDKDIINTVAGDTSLTIPSFVFADGVETYQRLMEWCGGDSDVFLLAQVTDVHSGGSEKYKVVGWLNELNALYNFNVLGNWGDIGLDTAATNGNKEATYSLVANTKKQMCTNSPWIFLKGNHERIEDAGIGSENIYGEIFNKATRRNFPNIVLSPNGDYGYIKEENTRVMVIFLNSSDTSSGSYYGIGEAQYNWFIDTLSGVEDGWSVVVGAHYCPHPIGYWKGSDGTAPTTISNASQTLMDVLKGFANHTSGTATVSNNTVSFDLSWNFTGKTSKLVCVLSGDSHFNANIKEDGVNYVVRQGYGGIGASEKPEHAVTDAFTWTRQCLFDVLAVKGNGEAKVFRIGAGGEQRDLEIDY